MHREARETLRDYYSTLDYYEFFLEETEGAPSNVPGRAALQDQLAIRGHQAARSPLFRAGFYRGAPGARRAGPGGAQPRPAAGIATYHDGRGGVGAYLSFTLGQFGRSGSGEAGQAP